MEAMEGINGRPEAMAWRVAGFKCARDQVARRAAPYIYRQLQFPPAEI
jgi:hypothetical protein